MDKYKHREIEKKWIEFWDKNTEFYDIKDDDGRPHRPLGWEGAPPGGHHRKGVLRCDAVTPLPQAVELQIRRTGEASPRVFRWQPGQLP